MAHLPAGLTEHGVVEAARARGVGLYGMSEYRADRDPGPAQLLIGFGNTTESAIASGIHSVAELIAAAA